MPERSCMAFEVNQLRNGELGEFLKRKVMTTILLKLSKSIHYYEK